MNETSMKINISTPGNGKLFNTTLQKSNNTRWYYNWTIPMGSSNDGAFTVKIYAKDNASNYLSPYPTLDATKHIDNTPPVSAVHSLIPSYHDTSAYLALAASASDALSGLDSVDLLYYYSTDNFTWTGPYSYGMNTTPWYGISWNFSFLTTNDTGYYRFYSIATDNASNTEAAPITNDTWCLYNFTNSPPWAAKNPSPANGTIDASTSTTLGWASGGDPDGNPITYDVYFGTDQTPDATELKTQHQNMTLYNPGSLAYSTTYYWMILSRDNHSIGTIGPTWSFTTRSAPQNPGGGGAPYSGNVVPVADAGGPYTGYVNQSITVNGSKSSEMGGMIVGYRWDWTSDGIYDTNWSTSAIATHIYGRIGIYDLKLQVKDNANAISNDTAMVIITSQVLIKASDACLRALQTQFGLTLSIPFYAYDANGDGIVDLFTDPNQKLSVVRFAGISHDPSFLLSIDRDDTPELFWDTTTNTITPVNNTPVGVQNATISPDTYEVIIRISVQKTGWLYLIFDDPYPFERYPDFTLTITTSEGRSIPQNLIWRENKTIYLLDDPSITYQVVYTFTTLPATLQQPNGAIFEPMFTPTNNAFITSARPQFTITYYEPVILTTVTFNNQDIAGQLTTIDHKTFLYTPPSDLSSGTYKLTLNVKNTNGNSLSSTVSYTISPTTTQPLSRILILIFLICIVLISVIALAILRKFHFI
jgi:hypothetical protein